MLVSSTARRLLRLLVAPGMVAVTVGIALSIGSISLHAAEAERLDERTGLVRDEAMFGTRVYSYEDTRKAIDAAGFAPENSPELNELLLQQFAVNGGGDPALMVALVDRDARPLGIRPSGRDVPDVRQFESAWRKALDGEIVMAGPVTYDDQQLPVQMIPVGGARPWAVVLAAYSIRGSFVQAFHQQVGTLGSGPGGVSGVYPDGRVMVGWNPEQPGQRIIDPQRLQGRSFGDVTTWYDTVDGHEMVTIVFSTGPDAVAMVYQQRTEDLFADLREQRSRRDRTMFTVFGLAVAALGAFSWARRRAERRERACLDALLHNSRDVVIVADRATRRITSVSSAVGQLLDHDPDDLVGTPLDDLVASGDRAALAQLVEHPEGTLLDIRLCRPDGNLRWFDVEASDLTHHPDVQGVLITCHEVGQRKQLQDELTSQALHDSLTGLPNRALFQQRLDALTVGDAGSASVFVVDLDGFKLINDAHGHETGDRVLEAVARRLDGAVGAAGLVARLGGDEFGILLDDADEQVARQCAARILNATRSPIATGGHRFDVGLSVGVATMQRGRAVNGGELLRTADHAMYDAKRGGGRAYVHQHCVATPGPGPRLAAARAVARPAAVTASAEPAGPPSGSPPDAVGPSARAGRERRPLSSFVPFLVAALVVAGVAAVGVQQERQAWTETETRRISDRLDLVADLASFASKQSDPARLVEVADVLPFTLEPDAPLDRKILSVLAESAIGGPGSGASLRAPDGTMLSREPADFGFELGPGDPGWAAAMSGEAGIVFHIDRDGTGRNYQFVPVRRDGRVLAVLTIAQNTLLSSNQEMLAAAGTLGFGTGGLLIVNGKGDVAWGWDPDLVGHARIDPAALAGDGSDRPREIGSDRDSVTLVAPILSIRDPDPFYMVFEQPRSVLFRDVTEGQTARDLSLLAVVLMAIIALAVSNGRREAAIRGSRRRLDALLHNAHDIVAVVGPNGTVSFVSSAVTDLLGHDRALIVAEGIGGIVHPDDADRVASLLSAETGHRPDVLTDLRFRTAAGGYRWFDLEVADLRHHPEIGGLVVTGHEVSERRALQDELDFMARHDALTGLANRAVLNEALDRLAEETPERYAVLFIDLDHFKPVNDAFGHEAGDAVLCVVAERLLVSVRRDGHRPRDVVCRLGGDEFAVLLVDTDLTYARDVAERILTALRRHIEANGHEVTIGATVGVGLSPRDGANPVNVLRSADAAMYAGKRAGRDRYEIYEPETT